MPDSRVRRRERCKMHRSAGGQGSNTSGKAVMPASRRDIPFELRVTGLLTLALELAALTLFVASLVYLNPTTSNNKQQQGSVPGRLNVALRRWPELLCFGSCICDIDEARSGCCSNLSAYHSTNAQAPYSRCLIHLSPFLPGRITAPILDDDDDDDDDDVVYNSRYPY
ncbi:hypothetical protein V8E54_007256 [Elaphomyces granulatus]